MRRRAGFCLALMLAWFAPAVRAQTDPAETARAAAEALRAAAQALEDAGGARDRVAALTETIRAYEAGLEAVREGIRRAAIRERALTLDLEARRDEIAGLLGALMSIESVPEPLLLLHPSGPEGAVRAAMLLGDVTPALQAEADALRDQLDEVTLMRTLQHVAADRLAEGLAGAQRARTELSQAISERRAPPRAPDSDALRRLVEGSDTLDGFAAALARDDATAPDGARLPDFEGRKGSLPMPVEGTILRRYEEPDAAGIRRPGLVLATRPLALVTTPVAATIRFRGPLLDYGNVIVLEPAEGYLLVLAGLGRVYGADGDVLPEGSPVGLMGGSDPATDVFPGGAPDRGGALQTETLYMELRKGGSPVDPTAWFVNDEELRTP
jgi:septal ring factor EnvC (AmiA/AmiB activator)